MGHEHLGKILHQISINIQKNVNHRLKDLDLSMTQGLALIWLEEAKEGELSIKMLEKMFETAQPTVLGVINRLEQKNLVSSHISENRKKMVEITEEGLKIVENIKICISEVDGEIFKDFSVGEQTIFLELLQKAKENSYQ